MELKMDFSVKLINSKEIHFVRTINETVPIKRRGWDGFWKGRAERVE
jgi:hypothetical protein